MLEASGLAVAELVDRVMADHHLKRPTIVAVGGGAGGLGRHVATLLGLECVVPPEAEVISSVGDALSLLRAERERTVSTIDPDDLRQLAREVEAELQAAGASPGSIEVRVEEEPEKGTIRAVATGAVGLRTGARPGREAEDEAGLARAAAEAGYGSPERAGEFWLARRDSGSHQRVLVLDRFGDPVAEVAGEVVTDPADLDAAAGRETRHRGPVTLHPTIWVIDGAHLIELTSADAVVTARGYAATAAAMVVGRTA
jgi:hypothetical protein